MRDLDKGSWAQLSPLLDRALDLEEEERAGFVADLRRDHPLLADKLNALLAAHEQACHSDFLAAGPSLAALPAPSLAGATIGAYTLDRPLGMGGMGSVWLAHRSDGRFTGQVAVKLVNLAVLDERARDRFAREATILARLAHPRIARLLDAGVTPVGQPYLVLEYVEGARIDRHADERTLDVATRLRLFLQVAEAVTHAHANLVVHRDLKPSNILVDADGRVKLLDFGIARLIDDDPGAGATVSSAIMLTPEYAAPEQARHGLVTTATDVYALGVLLFELLCGEHPTARNARTPAEFLSAADTDAERLGQALRVVAASPAQASRVAAARGTSFDRLARACAGDLDLILNTALKRDPAERYDSVAAFAADLRRHLDHEPVSAQADSLWYRANKFVRRRRIETAAVAAVFLALVIGAGVAVWQAHVTARERDVALRQLGRAQSINDLNEFLLADAAPLGQAFTAGQVLARAERAAARQQAGDPAMRVDTLVTIGRQYASQDESSNAHRVLARAYEMSRGVADVSVRAKAACAYAGALADGGDYPRAQAMASEALAQLPRDAMFALDRAFCSLGLAHIERIGPDPRAAIAHVVEAGTALTSSGLGSPLLHLRQAMELAESYREAGLLLESAVAFEDAFARLTALGRDDTETAGTLLNNWALTLLAIGRPLDAERLFRQAVHIASADGTEASVSPMLLTNLARPLVELGRIGEALDLADRAAALAQQAGYVVVYNQGLLLRATAARLLGDLGRAGRLIDEFEQRAARDIPPGHVAHDILVLDRARLAASSGEAATAAAGFDRAVTALDVPAPERRDALHRALLGRLTFRLSAGQVEPAIADAERAIAVSKATYGDDVVNFHTGRSYLALGEALVAAGRRDDARSALDAALMRLLRSVGPDHADVRAARTRRLALGPR